MPLLEIIEELVNSNFYGDQVTTTLKSDEFFNIAEGHKERKYTFLETCSMVIESGITLTCQKPADDTLFCNARYVLIGDLHGRGDMLIRILYHAGLILIDEFSDVLYLNPNIESLLKKENKRIDIYITGDITDENGFCIQTIAIIDGLNKIFDKSGVIKLHPIIGDYDYELVKRLASQTPEEPLPVQESLAACMLEENIKRGDYKLLEYNDDLKLISHSHVEKAFIIQVFAKMLKEKGEKDDLANKIYEVDNTLNDIYMAIADPSKPQLSDLAVDKFISGTELNSIIEKKGMDLADIVNYANNKFMEDVKLKCRETELPPAYIKLSLAEFEGREVRTGVGKNSEIFVKNPNITVGGPLYSTKNPMLELQIEEAISNFAKGILLSLDFQLDWQLDSIKQEYELYGETYSVTCSILNKDSNKDIKEQFISRIKDFSDSDVKLPPEFRLMSRKQLCNLIIKSLTSGLAAPDDLEVRNWIGHFSFGQHEIAQYFKSIPYGERDNVSIFKRYNKTFGMNCGIYSGIGGFIIVDQENNIFDIHANQNQVSCFTIQLDKKRDNSSDLEEISALSKLMLYEENDWTIVRIGKLKNPLEKICEFNRCNTVEPKSQEKIEKLEDSLEKICETNECSTVELKSKEKNRKFMYIMMGIAMGIIVTLGLTVGLIRGISGSWQAFNRIIAGGPLSNGIFIGLTGFILLSGTFLAAVLDAATFRVVPTVNVDKIDKLAKGKNRYDVENIGKHINHNPVNMTPCNSEKDLGKSM